MYRPASKNPREEDLSVLRKAYDGGQIMFCNSKTQSECLRKELFGQMRKHRNSTRRCDSVDECMSAIGENTILFLWNVSMKKLMGCWIARGKAAIDIDKTAWGGGFPYQVRTKELFLFHSLNDSVLRKHLDFFKRWDRFLKLSSQQVKDLIELFISEHAKTLGRKSSPVCITKGMPKPPITKRLTSLPKPTPLRSPMSSSLPKPASFKPLVSSKKPDQVVAAASNAPGRGRGRGAKRTAPPIQSERGRGGGRGRLRKLNTSETVEKQSTSTLRGRGFSTRARARYNRKPDRQVIAHQLNEINDKIKAIESRGRGRTRARGARNRGRGRGLRPANTGHQSIGKNSGRSLTHSDTPVSGRFYEKRSPSWSASNSNSRDFKANLQRSFEIDRSSSYDDRRSREVPNARRNYGHELREDSESDFNPARRKPTPPTSESSKKRSPQRARRKITPSPSPPARNKRSCDSRGRWSPSPRNRSPLRNRSPAFPVYNERQDDSSGSFRMKRRYPNFEDERRHSPVRRRRKITPSPSPRRSFTPDFETRSGVSPEFQRRQDLDTRHHAHIARSASPLKEPYNNLLDNYADECRPSRAARQWEYAVPLAQPDLQQPHQQKARSRSRVRVPLDMTNIPPKPKHRPQRSRSNSRGDVRWKKPVKLLETSRRTPPSSSSTTPEPQPSIFSPQAGDGSSAPRGKKKASRQICTENERKNPSPPNYLPPQPIVHVANGREHYSSAAETCTNPLRPTQIFVDFQEHQPDEEDVSPVLESNDLINMNELFLQYS